ncbi:phosphatase PAP2 family protein [Sandaracinus amylolyticus]|uniref:phosphatase PAP2 family protein n=1 Tax=Sandaracinus amylolyticus TaxID=927083 RepID=UPI00146FCF17|nr:phosphatase PAP2 family protein [Sandaracinus amylolyticus]
MHRRARASIAVLVAACSIASLWPASECSAQSSDAQEDGPTDGRTPVSDVAGVWAGAGTAMLGLGVGLFFSPSDAPADTTSVWRGGMLLDDDFRDAMRASTPEGQGFARRASDLMMVGLMANALLIDSLLIPLVQGDPDLAWQASFAYSLALGTMLTAGSIVKRVTSRARPFEQECAANPDAPGCGSADAYHSFFSLHTGVAFTSAAFSCAMHLERNLYDDPMADAVACGSALTAAALVGTLRVVADAHYLSDVLVGAVLGGLIGYLVPLAVVPKRSRVAHEIEQEAIAEEEALGLEVPAPTYGVTWSVTPMFGMGDDEGGTGPMAGTTSRSGVTLGASISGTF